MKQNIEILGKNVTKIKRSNKIIYKNRYIKYPFENELSKLPKDKLDYCLHTFLNNPFENYDYENMLQFFLKFLVKGSQKLILNPIIKKYGNLNLVLWILKWLKEFQNHQKLIL